MSVQIIAEGTNIDDIAKADALIAEGEIFDVQIITEEDISDAQLAEIKNILRQDPNVRSFKVKGGNILQIRMQKPVGSENVGFIFTLGLLGIIGILGGITVWKVLSFDPGTFILKSLPFLGFGLGAFFIYKYFADKKRSVATRVMGYQ